MTYTRPLAAIVRLPLVAIIIVPGLILIFAGGVDTRWTTTQTVYGLVFAAGLLLICSGMFLFTITVYLFHVVG